MDGIVIFMLVLMGWFIWIISKAAWKNPIAFLFVALGLGFLF